MITETDDVAAAIDAAAQVWPEIRGDRAALLRKVVQQGAESLAASGAEAVARRMSAIRRTAGALPDVYRQDEARRLREEWPE